MRLASIPCGPPRLLSSSLQILIPLYSPLRRRIRPSRTEPADRIRGIAPLLPSSVMSVLSVVHSCFSFIPTPARRRHVESRLHPRQQRKRPGHRPQEGQTRRWRLAGDGGVDCHGHHPGPPVSWVRGRGLCHPHRLDGSHPDGPP